MQPTSHSEITCSAEVSPGGVYSQHSMHVQPQEKFYYYMLSIIRLGRSLLITLNRAEASRLLNLDPLNISDHIYKHPLRWTLLRSIPQHPHRLTMAGQFGKEAGAALAFGILYFLMFIYMSFMYATKRYKWASRFTILYFHCLIRVASQVS